eukprot:COSAG01_NODE_5830_length_4007_cov_2.086489_1_plen_130_part_00
MLPKVMRSSGTLLACTRSVRERLTFCDQAFCSCTLLYSACSGTVAVACRISRSAIVRVAQTGEGMRHRGRAGVGRSSCLLRASHGLCVVTAAGAQSTHHPATAEEGPIMRGLSAAPRERPPSGGLMQCP